jgi:predicted RNA binding protein YcfA (HicA-like mRNA interferase family)
MMLKPLSRRELLRKFRALGFSGPFSGGRHQFMVKGTHKIRVPDPHHSDIDASLLKEILRQAGLSAEEWEEA